ncbi:MAG: hypothetical protein ABWW66_01675 [Archaeoglobaceae archaeon]
MEVYYFTFTGNSKRVAEHIASKFGVEAFEVRAPKFPYAVWLVLSFFPLLEVPAEFKPVESEKVVFCFPKWTLNCPPATFFIRRLSVERLALVISYSGFDEVRYAEFYKKLALKHAGHCEYFLVKRGSDFEDLAERVREFLRA